MTLDKHSTAAEENLNIESISLSPSTPSVTMAASDARAQAVLTFLETIETIDSIAGIVDENGEKLGRLLKAIANIDRKPIYKL
ncbi:hypothetical protein NPX13_g7530 [Xylaria arbuscula]|uniref:Uncharacterized protein n=1 Tax=Xylaria arbuscula TaxID=114810 RepID=A0A9W8TL33_9PEZI|nr:hypothetical protein NPX13_g7530 [Xylaria arbuscula]